MKDSLQIESLKQKLYLLQNSIDSIKSSNNLENIKFKLNEKQDLITQINTFYDSAWLKLIIVISILGILVPIIAQYFQRKNLNDLTEFIRNQMNDSLEFKINELKNFNKTEIEKTLLELKENIKAIETKNNGLVSELDGGLFYLQGQIGFKDKRYTESARDFIRSLYYWLETNKTERLSIVCGNIAVSLKRLTKKEEYEKVKGFINSTLNMTIEEVIKHFETHDYYNFCEEKLNEIKIEIERLKNVG